MEDGVLVDGNTIVSTLLLISYLDLLDVLSIIHIGCEAHLYFVRKTHPIFTIHHVVVKNGNTQASGSSPGRLSAVDNMLNHIRIGRPVLTQCRPLLTNEICEADLFI